MARDLKICCPSSERFCYSRVQRIAQEEHKENLQFGEAPLSGFSSRELKIFLASWPLLGSIDAVRLDERDLSYTLSDTHKEKKGRFRPFCAEAGAINCNKQKTRVGRKQSDRASNEAKVLVDKTVPAQMIQAKAAENCEGEEK